MKSVKKFTSLLAACIMAVSMASISCSAADYGTPSTVGDSRSEYWLTTYNGRKQDILLYHTVTSGYKNNRIYGEVLANYYSSQGVRTTSRKYNDAKRHFARVTSGGKVKETMRHTSQACETGWVKLKNGIAWFEGIYYFK